MALLDMLRSASFVPLAAILDRQQALGEYDLRKAAESDSPKAPYFQERIALLEDFHRFAESGAGDWLSWRSRRDPRTPGMGVQR
jgi:hypothetical protein